MLVAVKALVNRLLNPPSHPESTLGLLTMAGKTCVPLPRRLRAMHVPMAAADRVAGARVEVRASPTRDDAKLRSSMHGIAPTGKVNFAHALKIGFVRRGAPAAGPWRDRALTAPFTQLALKHRLNKAGQQRLVAFVGSPILEKDATLKRIAKELRKNNVRFRRPRCAVCAATDAAPPLCRRSGSTL